MLRVSKCFQASIALAFSMASLHRSAMMALKATTITASFYGPAALVLLLCSSKGHWQTEILYSNAETQEEFNWRLVISMQRDGIDLDRTDSTRAPTFGP
jgi:hypothetical protein